MTPQSYERLMELFDQSADLPDDEKATFIASVRAETPELASELTRMLRFDRRGAASIKEAIQSVALPLVAETDPASIWTGKRAGPYIIEREIGRGGMGVVFEAVRSDDEYRKRVALKIAPRSSFSEDFRQRFRHERQILAQLEHPNIARLLDGGTTPDGMPYFAMEYVEGLPVHTYCEENQLSVPQRLELFLSICDAVDYAHQHLVVHRDIKPANILVSNKGIPKLLDFGIAKLLDPGTAPGAGLTQTIFAPVTPDYCTPEQVVGERITTRTDVYLLGLLLFEMLCGERAQKADTSSAMALEKSIRATEIPMASASGRAQRDQALARALRGDLDTIVATATRKEPERRFAGVAAMADEIRLYLQGRPITSRPESLWYRAVKFVRRNALASAAAAGFLFALIGGIVSTTYQARRAAHRFDQVRGLSNSMLFDIHDSIKVLPGSVEAQNKVVQTSLKYLDTLAAEASGDIELQIDVAAGYVRVGGIQADQLVASMGDREGGKRSLLKAKSILDPLVKEHPDSEHAVVVLVDANVSLAEILGRDGSSEEGVRLLEEAIRAATPVAAKPGASLLARRRLGLAHMSLVRDYADRKDGVQKAEALIAATLTLENDIDKHRDVMNEVGVANSVAAGAYVRAGEDLKAVPLLEKAVALQTKVVERNPQDTVAQRGAMLAHAKLGDVLLGKGAASLNRRADGLAHLAKMAEYGERLYIADPKPKANRVNYAMSLLRYSDAKPAEDSTAIEGISNAIRILNEVAADDSRDFGTRRHLSEATARLGSRLARREEWNLGKPRLQEAVQIAERFTIAEPASVANHRILIYAYIELGKQLRKRNSAAELDQLRERAKKHLQPDFLNRFETAINVN